jgi:hypothetical protein
MSQDEIRVNGKIADGSIVIKLRGKEYSGFTEISYDDGVEVGKVWGLSKFRGPRGRTRGKYDASDASLKGPKSTIEELFKDLKSISDDGSISGPEFPITVAYVDGTKSYVDTLKQCRVLKRKAGPPAADSADAVIDELTLSVMSIDWNGNTLFVKVG